MLTHAPTQKGARFVKLHVQMAASVLLVRQFASSNGSCIPRDKEGRCSLSVGGNLFLQHFTLKAMHELFLLA